MSARAAQGVRQEFGLDLTVERYAKVYEDLLASPAQVALAERDGSKLASLQRAAAQLGTDRESDGYRVLGTQ
jgi:hypothetical protein